MMIQLLTCRIFWRAVALALAAFGRYGTSEDTISAAKRYHDFIMTETSDDRH